MGIHIHRVPRKRDEMQTKCAKVVYVSCVCVCPGVIVSFIHLPVVPSFLSVIVVLVLRLRGMPLLRLKLAETALDVASVLRMRILSLNHCASSRHHVVLALWKVFRREEAEDGPPLAERVRRLGKCEEGLVTLVR